MLTLAKRIAFAIAALAREQGGAAQITAQIIVACLATTMALCSGLLGTEHVGKEDVLIARVHDVEADATGALS